MTMETSIYSYNVGPPSSVCWFINPMKTRVLFAYHKPKREIGVFLAPQLSELSSTGAPLCSLHMTQIASRRSHLVPGPGQVLQREAQLLNQGVLERLELQVRGRQWSRPKMRIECSENGDLLGFNQGKS